MSGLLNVLFCNCCYGGCDCGCVLDCRMVDHREAAGITKSTEEQR